MSYASKEVDQLILEAQQNCDRAARQKAYRRIHQLILEDAPYTFLFSGPQYGLLDRRVRWHRDQIEARTDIPGQLFDFGKSTHCLDALFNELSGKLAA